jgi:uncharacterized phage protein (TIGR01671 family)
VWDKKDKEYLDPNYYEEFAVTPDGVIHVGLTVDNGICDEFQVIPPKQLIVEQCTGLKDKNGNLIFEGDVVNMYIPYEDNYYKCVVQYVIDEGTAQWLAVYLEGKRHHMSLGIAYDITTEYLDGSYCTVIGTIHDEQFREVTKKWSGH